MVVGVALLAVLLLVVACIAVNIDLEIFFGHFS
jgi:hypothetical protein